ncbi:MAG: hybrid sensor histidine kinase/response regulator [Paludibacter sp.]|nr:hybrid sensor histidine kinase/response regulator [Paludibacter sp.]
MASSLLSLKLKIIVGYVALVLLFLVLLIFIYRENRQLSVIDKRAEKALAQREQVEAITLQILDISQLNGQVIAWDEKELPVYKEKLNKVTVLLQELQKQILNKSQRNRITSILALLSAKNTQILAIVKDLKKLQTTHELLNKHIPNIIQQAKQDRRHLAEQIGDNYGKSEKKSGGFLGLFRNKKKIQDQTETENEAILQKNQARSDTLLRSLSNQIRLTHDKQNKQLFTHMDSLNKQNVYLNSEINRLITEFNIIEQLQMKEKTESYLLGQEKALLLVSGLGIGATLLAIVLYLILRHDLKNRYRYRIQLEQLNHSNEELLRARKNMMLTVSHDLRAPLTAIRGCTELLIDERYKEKRTHLCDTILQSSDNMTFLLNTLLNFYRLDTGKEQPNSAPFRIKSLADTLTAEFNEIAHRAGLEFSTECIGGDAVVTGDRERLIQIAGNLLSNAVKFTSEGEVRLRLCYQEGTLTIEVSDTGTGLTSEQIGQIFKPFERLENAKIREGFGLGLAIVQGLTALLNGKIEVQSELGKGSTFTILMPLLVAEEQHFTHEVALSSKLPARIRVLVIDNDAVLLLMTRDMLTRSRVHCDICRDIQELIQKMRDNEYDLLITDIQMPQMSGFDLLELLRTSDIGTSRTIPVLAATARVDFGEADFTAAGFAGCLYKPFSITELLSAVEGCVGGHSNQFGLQANFSELLSSEQNGEEMLKLLIRETEKDMQMLMESTEKEDCQATTLLVHHLLPLWEIVRVDIPLRELCQVLAEENGMKSEKIRNAVDRVIATGKQLTMQAAEKIKEVYE